MHKSKHLILFGTGDLARISYEYFTNDSEYEVLGFTVDKEFLYDDEFCGLPIVPFENVDQFFSPIAYEMHVCIVYGRMNRLRASRCAAAKLKGYKLASFISPQAFVSPSAKIGEHAFIFEDNTIQSDVTIGDNCILWSGNHIGHDSKIGNNVFISSHVVVSGHCEIGDNVFIGVNSTMANGTKLGGESWVMHGSVMSGKIPPKSFVKSIKSEVVPLNESGLLRALQRVRE